MRGMPLRVLAGLVVLVVGVHLALLQMLPAAGLRADTPAPIAFTTRTVTLNPVVPPPVTTPPPAPPVQPKPPKPRPPKPRPATPPGFAHFVSLLLPPCRGHHQRPGRASSAVFA